MSGSSRPLVASLVLAVFALVGLVFVPSPGLAQPHVVGSPILIRVPQFVANAVKFHASDETGWDFWGSDEVYAVFSDMNPLHYDHATSIYGNVDSGDTITFKAADRCVGPQPSCNSGVKQMNFVYTMWERDSIPTNEFCPGDGQGSHSRLYSGLCTEDDLIGHGHILKSQAELEAELPNVGDSREYTDKPIGGDGSYTFTYRITRLANIEREIVIHQPPPEILFPIALHATAATNPSRAVLTWSGATTPTVDLYRNGVKFTTTANDGAFDDTRPPGTYQYRVCDLGSTTSCSAIVSVVVT